MLKKLLILLGISLVFVVGYLYFFKQTNFQPQKGDLAYCIKDKCFIFNPVNNANKELTSDEIRKYSLSNSETSSDGAIITKEAVPAPRGIDGQIIIGGLVRRKIYWEKGKEKKQITEDLSPVGEFTFLGWIN